MSSTADRVDCSHRPPCPGCPRLGEPGIAPGPALALARIAREAGAALAPVREAGAVGHRHRARLMVRGRARAPRIGIFERGTHRVVHIPRCPVHHPVVNRAAEALARAIRATGCPPYADAPHRGCVRALQVVVERASQRAQVVVVTNDATLEATPRAVDLLAALADDLASAELLHSLWWNGNPARTNTILGPHWRLVAAPGAPARAGAGALPDEAGWVCERIGGARVWFPPGAFGQSHLALADAIVERVHALAARRGARRIAEAHAGCGAIGLGLLARGAHVAFNEQSPAGLAGLARGIADAQPEGPGAARARVLAGPAGEAAGSVSGPAGSAPGLLDGAELAIVDPPRRGLEPSLAAALAASDVPAIAYVSCSVTSLERDLAVLLESGRLALTSLEPFALFPFTEHVETLAVLEVPGRAARSSPPIHSI
ncbi:MAG: hypothetical protein R3E88_11740 [Myxococcota bacterium]